MKVITLDKAISYSKIVSKILIIVKPLIPEHVPIEDLQQEAMLAVMKAVNEYDSTRRVSDVTLVYKYVITHMKNYARKVARASRVIDQPQDIVGDHSDAVLRMLDLESRCTVAEWQILQLRTAGLTLLEISNQMELKLHQVRDILRMVNFKLDLAARDV